MIFAHILTISLATYCLAQTDNSTVSGQNDTSNATDSNNSVSLNATDNSTIASFTCLKIGQLCDYNYNCSSSCCQANDTTSQGTCASMPASDPLTTCSRPLDANMSLPNPNCTTNNSTKSRSGRMHGFLIIVIVVPFCGSTLIAILIYAIWSKFCKRTSSPKPTKAKIHTDMSLVTLTTIE